MSKNVKCFLCPQLRVLRWADYSEEDVRRSHREKGYCNHPDIIEEDGEAREAVVYGQAPDWCPWREHETA